MNFRVALILFYIFLLLGQDEEPYLILISFDGFRYDYPDKTETKALDFLAENGVKAKSLIPVFPSKTFSNHYSIITGMYPENHGLINNNFYDKAFKQYYSARDPKDVTDPKWYNGVPIWEVLEENDIKTASFFWVGSETKINGFLSSYYYQYNHYYPNKDRINQVIDWLSLPEIERPHFISLYFPMLDDAGHIYGPEAPEMSDVIQQADSYIAYLLKQIKTLPIADRINLIIVSDHGMTATKEDHTILLSDIMDFTPSQIIDDKPFQMMFFDDKLLEQTVYTTFMNHDHISVFRKNEIPKQFHFQNVSRTPDLLFLADDGYSINFKPAKISRGNHGYSPEVQNMHAIFYAYGPFFRENLKIEPFENIHIYPLIAKLFNLTYTHQIDGDFEVLKPILKNSIQKNDDN